MGNLFKSDIKKRLNPLRPLKNQSGIAIIIAMFALALMIYIAVEVQRDSEVEYVIASQQVNRIKAYYAAKAGIEMSLLRIQLYKQAMVSLGETLGPQKSMLDLIWQFPLSWPPMIPEKDVKMTEMDKSAIQSSVKDSLMEAQYATTISPETGKLNLNNLASEVKGVQTATRAELMNIFDQTMKTNEEFRKKYGTTNFDELVNNIVEWVAPDKGSGGGGDKSSRYGNFDFKDTNRDFIPPGRPFKTMDELHMVAGMTDDIYKLLEARVTVYGIEGVNINYAGKEMLMALDQSFTEEAVNAVMKRRNDPKEGGPFPSGADCAKTFFDFISPFGVNVRAISDSKIVLLCDPEFNFRVTSTGTIQKTKREITVITYDLDNLPARLADLLDKQDAETNGGNTPPPSASPPTQPTGAGPGGNADDKKSKMKAPKGRPTVVYWEET